MTIVIDISKFVNSNRGCDIEPALYLSDDLCELKRLKADGHIVLPILNENTENADLSAYKYVIVNPDEVDEDYYYKIWLRYAGLPWHILNTGRCIVREMTCDDLKELYELYSDECITKYTEALFPDYEDEYEYTNNYIERVYSYFGFGTWIILRKSDEKIIGRAGFNYRPGFDEPELGYMIGEKYQNKGYAYEVCSAIIEYGLNELEFKRISAFSADENIKSSNLLKKLGFRQDGFKNVFFESGSDRYQLRHYIYDKTV